MAQLDWLNSVSSEVSTAPASQAPSASQPLKHAIMTDSDPEQGVPEKAEGAYKTISEVAEELDVPTHVLRFWESRFSQVKPQRMRGGRRYYRPADVETLKKIKTLLYSQGYTIKGAKKHVKDKSHAIHTEVAMEALAKALAPEMPKKPAAAAPVPKKKPGNGELSSLIQELRDLKKSLSAFA